MNIFSWSKTEHNNIIPFVRSDYRYVDDPMWGCEATADRLAKTPSGNRYLYIHGLGYSVDGKDEIMDLSDPAGVVRRGGYYMPAKRYCRKLFSAIKACGIFPNFVVLDYEGGFEPWRFFPNPGQEWVDFIAKVQDDPLAWSLVPTIIKQNGPEAFRSWAGINAMNAWNQWSELVRSRALHYCVFDVAVEVFGKNIPMGNHTDFNYGNQKVPSLYCDFVSGSTAIYNRVCPVAYLQRFSSDKYGVPGRWSNMIDVLNRIKACVNSSSGLGVLPWISYPGYCGDNLPDVDPWLWIELMKHLQALGIASCLFFNPHMSSVASTYEIEQDRLSSEIFTKVNSEVKVENKPVGGWAFERFDAAEIRTGSVISKLSDFVE